MSKRAKNTGQTFKITLNNSAGELDSVLVLVAPEMSETLKDGVLKFIDNIADFYDGDTITIREIAS